MAEPIPASSATVPSDWSIPRPKENRHMLQSTKYAINNSFSKTIVVGYALNKGLLEPSVQINGLGTHGITLSSVTWWKLKSAIETISSYFADTDGPWDTPLDLSACMVTFSSAHGCKAVILSEVHSPNNRPDAEEHPDTEYYPRAKKPRYATAVIVMQRTTWDRLVAVAPCVSAYLGLLCGRIRLTNACKSELVLYVAKKANAHGIVAAPLGRYIDLVTSMFGEATARIKGKIKKSNFVKNFYDQTMLEIQALFTEELGAEVKGLTDPTEISTQTIDA